MPRCQVMRAAGKHLRGSQLREVFLSGVEVRESSGTPGLEHTLLAALTTNLHHLTLLSLAGLKLSPTQAQVFGKVRWFRLRQSRNHHSHGLCLKGGQYSVMIYFEVLQYYDLIYIHFFL